MPVRTFAKYMKITGEEMNEKPNSVPIMHIWFLNEHSSERYDNHTYKHQKAITIDYYECGVCKEPCTGLLCLFCLPLRWCEMCVCVS